MSTPTSSDTPWIKAARSANQGSCVEMRRHAGHIEVRDSKDHGAGPILRLTTEEWSAWLHSARSGEFDDLLGS